LRPDFITKFGPNFLYWIACLMKQTMLRLEHGFSTICRRLPMFVVLVLSLLVFSPQTANASAAELVMFESEGCEWCETWHDEIGVVYSKTGESAVLPLRLVDADEDFPDDLADVPGIFYTPTFVIMKDGLERGRITGYPGEDFFWQLLDEIIEKMDAKRADGS